MMEIKNPWREFRGLHKGSKMFQEVAKIMEQESEKANANDDVIPRSSLPALPDGWDLPIEELLTDKGYWVFADHGMSRQAFLAALLNAVYGGVK